MEGNTNENIYNNLLKEINQNWVITKDEDGKSHQSAFSVNLKYKKGYLYPCKDSDFSVFLYLNMDGSFKDILFVRKDDVTKRFLFTDEKTLNNLSKWKNTHKETYDFNYPKNKPIIAAIIKAIEDKADTEAKAAAEAKADASAAAAISKQAELDAQKK
jgi:hypothetical protein